MSTSPQKKENANTYFVQDKQLKEELVRLTLQDHLLTTSMGGVLPEQTDPSIFQRVLDIGSGSGSWIIEAARTYPAMSLVGIDINPGMAEYASAQAHKHGLSERVTFQVMDALKKLEFPDASFDLVNLRFGISYLRTWDWPELLSEMVRILHPGGVVRLTEPEVIQISNSPAHMKLQDMLQCAFYKSGHLFENESAGLTAHLANFLKRYGLRQVQTKDYALEYKAGTTEGQTYYKDNAHAMSTGRPYLAKWGRLDASYDTLCQQALKEMQQSDFHATWKLTTAWGTKP